MDVFAKVFVATCLVLTYLAICLFSKKRAIIVASGALTVTIFLMFKSSNHGLEAIYDSVDNAFCAVEWNIILMLIGMMGIVALFINSQMPAAIGDFLVNKAGTASRAIILLVILAGIISAFVDNVATLMMLAPIGLSIARKAKISPIPVLISIAISSNLQGAATLIGDPAALLLAEETNMTFADFFIFQGRPGLFFIIQAGMVAISCFLIFLFRQYNQPIKSETQTKVQDFIPSILLLITLLLLILASFLPYKFELANGLVCILMLFVAAIYYLIKTRSMNQIRVLFTSIDWTTIFFLSGLFILIGALKDVGLIQDISVIFINLNLNPLLAYTTVVLFSVFIACFIDAVPYIITMLPVIGEMSLGANINPFLLYFGLIIGVTLGGNITPFGAATNIAASGILRKEGYDVKLRQYLKISLPFTLIAVSVGYLLILLFFY